MRVKYKGFTVIINIVLYNIDITSYKYGNTIIIFINDKLTDDKSKILHRILKKARS